MGGGDRPLRRSARPASGRSPRGRGRQGERRADCLRRWSIPAWAGETGGARRKGRGDQVDPRVGGGDLAQSRSNSSIRGRSPRGRGRPRARSRRSATPRSIPAWAGETMLPAWPGGSTSVDPRVGGGDGSASHESIIELGRSPRGRGRRQRIVAGGVDQRSIPAWAGETTQSTAAPSRVRVDPRVGGGDLAEAKRIVDGIGRSPRGRGRLLIAQLDLNLERSIPAWAGET